jgi:hypothetical protein
MERLDIVAIERSDGYESSGFQNAPYFTRRLRNQTRITHSAAAKSGSSVAEAWTRVSQIRALRRFTSK